MADEDQIAARLHFPPFQGKVGAARVVNSLEIPDVGYAGRSAAAVEDPAVILALQRAVTFLVLADGAEAVRTDIQKGFEIAFKILNHHGTSAGFRNYIISVVRHVARKSRELPCPLAQRLLF